MSHALQEEELRSALREIVRAAPDVDEPSRATLELAHEALEVLAPLAFVTIADELLDRARPAREAQR